MADYFTHFSCRFDVGTTENAIRALDIYQTAPDDDDGQCLSDGFLLALEEEGGTRLWLRDEVSGDVEQVIKFILRCAEAFDLKGLWGFEYANTCSRPRLDAFGGGAYVIDLGARQVVGWINTTRWLTEALNGGDPDA